MHELTGQPVMHRKTKKKGIIRTINENLITVLYGDTITQYAFPSSLSNILILKDEYLQHKYESLAQDSYFENFIKKYSKAIKDEIQYIKLSGGKRHRLIEGIKIEYRNGYFVYSFSTDIEFNLPERTPVKLWCGAGIYNAYVVYCEGFNIALQLMDYLGDTVDMIELSAEPWQLLESLTERLEDISIDHAEIAKMLVCKKSSFENNSEHIVCGQEEAFNKAFNQPITIIWGPPGTGKTETLAKISLECIQRNKRVLMVSYSNVSVDGALLRVAQKTDLPHGKVIRYGYPRMRELLESEYLTSYAMVLNQNPELFQEYKELTSEVKKLKNTDPRKVELKKKISSIRNRLIAKEKQLIQNSAFLATTVSKVVVDPAVYGQKFDVVIFDEASMAYVPQVVFMSSLAKEHFCCLGDFKQLPAIVQNQNNEILSHDIFEYTGIKERVDNGYGHEWLVMLDNQHRMHPDIADFAGKYMYNNMLKSATGLLDSRQQLADCTPIKHAPMGLVDLSFSYSVCVNTYDGSRINLLSALICVKIAELFAGKYEVGITTPYSAQSRLIIAILRDIQERNSIFNMVNCATVHQYQGSERPIIIYDAVDCFREPYPGILLTSKKNDTANRLFNVALTRTQGKFILVTNKDYMLRKNIAKDLLFTRAIKQMEKEHNFVFGEDILDEFGTYEDEQPEVFLGGRDEQDSWNRYICDIQKAKSEIIIDLPGNIDEDKVAIKELCDSIKFANDKNVVIIVRAEDAECVLSELKKFYYKYPYVTTPITIIDNNVLWFGEPLSSANFFTEGKTLETKFFPCLRFYGKHTVSMIKSMFGISKS